MGVVVPERGRLDYLGERLEYLGEGLEYLEEGAGVPERGVGVQVSELLPCAWIQGANHLISG